MSAVSRDLLGCAVCIPLAANATLSSGITFTFTSYALLGIFLTFVVTADKRGKRRGASSSISGEVLGRALRLLLGSDLHPDVHHHIHSLCPTGLPSDRRSGLHIFGLVQRPHCASEWLSMGEKFSEVKHSHVIMLPLA